VSFRDWSGTVVRRAAAVGSLPSDTADERLRKSALVLSSLLITTLSFIWVGTYAALGLWRRPGDVAMARLVPPALSPRLLLPEQ
jgi:hypothetical protein